jgi:hypothetical protein
LLIEATEVVLTREKETELKEKELKRNNLLKEKEELWCQRSRAIWIKSGDQNTKKNHNFANFRRNRKFIWEITDELGQIQTGQKNIMDTATNYFKNFFKETNEISILDQVKVAEIFPKMVTEIEAKNLFRPVGLEELRKVLKKFKVDKSPGPDGWTVEFFVHFFDLVGEDLLNMVEETRQKGKILGGLNSTFIALIPKVNKPLSFGDYRPISLCNLCYKIISKIIANRIKPFLSSMISEEQLSFLKGHHIQDAIGTVQIFMSICLTFSIKVILEFKVKSIKFT